MSNEQKTADEETLSKATEQLIEEVPQTTAKTEPAKADPEPEAPKTEETEDDREYREAKEALEAEQKSASLPPKPTEEIDPAKALPPQKTEAEKPPVDPKKEPPADDRSSPMIPKARFDEVLRQKEEASNNASYYKGIVDANKEMRTAAPAQTPTQPVQDPVKVAEETLNAIDAQKLDLAKKYDEGEMTAADWKAKEIDLDRKAAALRSEVNKLDGERIRREATEDARREAMVERLDEHAAKLEQRHPGLLELPKDGNHPRWVFLNQEAAQSLAAEGVVLKENDSRSTIILRERMGELADKYAPMWSGKPLPKPSAPSESTSPPADPSARKSPIAQQRLEKIQLAHQQPPPTGSIGSPGVKPELSDAQILTMSDDELLALPASTVSRLKGRAA